MAPLGIAVACFAVLLAPESVLPMPLTERVVWLAILDCLLVSYHFAAQHLTLTISGWPIAPVDEPGLNGRFRTCTRSWRCTQ